MNFARILADAVAEVIAPDEVIAGVPQLEASIGGVRKVVLHKLVFVTLDQHAAVPNVVGLVLPKRAPFHARQHDAAAPAVLPPAEFGIVKIAGEVATLNGPF